MSVSKKLAAAEAAAEKAVAEAALWEGYLAGTLPRSAVVHESGRQVVVSLWGRSITRYRSKAA